MGNGLCESAKFNSRLQVTEFNLGYGSESGNLWKLEQEYGEIDGSGNVDTAKNTGNIARQTVSFDGLSHPFVTSYKYDSLYRLTEARETKNSTQTWKQAFIYDRYGNRTGHEKFFGSTEFTQTNVTHPTIDANTNRFNGSQGFAYDKNGNLVTDPTDSGRSFVFNGDNKQKEVRDSNNVLIGEYFYDGEGKRVKKHIYNGGVISEVTIFAYSGGKLIAEYSTAPPEQNPTTKWTVTDQLGSPRILVDSLGQVVARRDFMPFGEEIFPDGTHRTTNLKYTFGDNVRQKFTGYQKDEETQLDFAEARMYQNLHARFTAVDPLLASGKNANPQTFNRYVYVMNNPLRFTDPTGLQAANYTGDVYYDEENDYYHSTPGSGRKLFTGSQTFDQTDGFRYTVDSNGWRSLGRTADLIEADISDLESIGIGLMNIVNRGFTMPMSPPGPAYNPFVPSFYDIVGWKPFSTAQTETKTWRDWGLASATELGVDAFATRGAGTLANAAPKIGINLSTRTYAFGARFTRSNGAVAGAIDTETLNVSFFQSGRLNVPARSQVHPSMRELITDAQNSGVVGQGGPRTCCEFKAVNDLLNRGAKRENIVYQVIDIRSQKPLTGCDWCSFTMRGTNGINGN